jgi:hypothetical protein
VAHLFAALGGMRFWLRQLGVEGPPAAVMALSWPLSTMVVYSAASWWNVVGVVAYLPWALGCAAAALRTGRRRWIAGLVGARLAMLAVGHLQNFLYAGLFEVVLIASLWLAARPNRRDSWRFAALYSASWGLTLAAALPVVGALWHQAQLSAERGTPFNEGRFFGGGFPVALWLRGAIDPFSEWPAQGPNWAPVLRHLSFVGYVPLLLVLALPWLRRPAKGEPPGSAIVVAVAGGLAGALTFGWLDPLLHVLPVFNRLRWPFRANVLVTFCLLTVAGLVLQRWRSARPAGGRLAPALVWGLMLVQWVTWLVLYCGFPAAPFNGQWIAERVPPVDPAVELGPDLRRSRVLTVGRAASDPWSSRTLRLAYPTAWGLFHVNGYGNLVAESRWQTVAALERGALVRGDAEGQARLRDWAVGWYFVARGDRSPAAERAAQRLDGWNLRAAARDQSRRVLRDPAALPLAAFADAPTAAVEFRVGGASLTFDLAPVAGERRLVLAFFRDPQLVAHDDVGHPLAVDALPDGRTEITVPAGARRVRLEYVEPRLRRGLWQGLGLGGLSLALAWLAGRR